jgi:rubrerythrin
MSDFEAADILEIAIRIEENGSTFYCYAAEIAEDEKTKKLFTHLADEEDQHKAVFGDMLSKIDKHKLPESYPGEYGSYLRDYVDGKIVFTRENLNSELSRIKDPLTALNFAIRRELDSILYYHEIKIFLPKTQHDAIDRIIDEERRHFETLSAIKKRHKK